jgi:DNA topoisomerase-1
MVKRRWRGGTFWGCSNYPTCKTAIFSDIEDVKCPQCKALYLVKKVSKDGTITLTCPNKECDYKVIKKSE